MKKKGFANKGTLTSPKARAAWEVLKHYHPYRYAAYRPWAPEMLKAYKRLNDGNLVSTNFEIPDEAGFVSMTPSADDAWGKLHRLMGKRILSEIEEAEIVTPYVFMAKMAIRAVLSKQSRGDDSPFERDPAQQALSSYAQDESKLYSHWACHALNNRAIFDFTPELTSMFARSEVGEAVLDQIKLPAETVYLHFGVQPDFPLNGRMKRSYESFSQLFGESQRQSGLHEVLFGDGVPSFLADPDWDAPKYFFEGAYISRNRFDPEGSLDVLLLARKIDEAVASPPQNFLEASDESLEYHIPCFHPGITIKEALFTERNNVDTSHIEAMRRHYERMSNGSMGAVGGLSSFDAWAEQLRKYEMQSRSDFERALNLILNALLYVSTYPEELETEYPPTTPLEITSLLEKTEQSDLPEKAINRYRREVEDLGYVKIKFCGRKVTAKAAELSTRNQDPTRQRTFKGRLGTWRFLDASKGRFKETRHIWVRPSPDPTGTKALTIYEVY